MNKKKNTVPPAPKVISIKRDDGTIYRYVEEIEKLWDDSEENKTVKCSKCGNHFTLKNGYVRYTKKRKTPRYTCYECYHNICGEDSDLEVKDNE